MSQRAQQAMQALMSLFIREGYMSVEPSLLQPADMFIELSGEDIRRRLFLTENQNGEKLCLRPEYTIPVCRGHLATRGSSPASYCYLGPVFRQRANESGQFLQAGIESIGRRDTAAADAEVLTIALEAVVTLGMNQVFVTFSDMGVLSAIIDALNVTAPAKRRILRAVIAGKDISTLAKNETSGLSDHAGLLTAIEGLDPKAAKAMVEDLLSIAGIDSIGGRTPGDIAARFLSRASDQSGIPAEIIEILKAYQSIAGDPDMAARSLRQLAANVGLNINRSLDAFEERTGFMAARGLDIRALTFSARFVRTLDYYTGFIFEIGDPERKDGKPVVGGGRYDGLVQHLGAREPIPAVGCSFWLERLSGVGL